MEKLCKCHDKPMFWHKDKRLKAGGGWHCSVKRDEANRRYRLTHTRHKTKRRYDLKRYGITEESFYSMLDQQQNRCAICGREFDRSREGAASVDHDHLTGSVRGLLCKLCNLGLGCFADSSEKLVGAIDYLSRSS
jgi:hypothetical protein